MILSPVISPDGGTNGKTDSRDEPYISRLIRNPQYTGSISDTGKRIGIHLIFTLGIFNKLTLVGLYDIKALETVGTGDVNTDFVWKFIVLARIAVVFYAAGAVRFQKKDLPL